MPLICYGLIDIWCQKPNPRFFEIGAKLAGSKNEETIYIGDNFYADVYGSWLSGL